MVHFKRNKGFNPLYIESWAINSSSIDSKPYQQQTVLPTYSQNKLLITTIITLYRSNKFPRNRDICST